ncbi:hypothetical protein OIU78_018122 [Salix suchowensis]|nr:hypothetical protein OIU78_018122 [Salix suchowensis]
MELPVPAAGQRTACSGGRPREWFRSGQSLTWSKISHWPHPPQITINTPENIAAMSAMLESHGPWLSSKKFEWDSYNNHHEGSMGSLIICLKRQAVRSNILVRRNGIYREYADIGVKERDGDKGSFLK